MDKAHFTYRNRPKKFFGNDRNVSDFYQFFINFFPKSFTKFDGFGPFYQLNRPKYFTKFLRNNSEIIPK